MLSGSESVVRVIPVYLLHEMNHFNFISLLLLLFGTRFYSLMLKTINLCVIYLRTSTDSTFNDRLSSQESLKCVLWLI